MWCIALSLFCLDVLLFRGTGAGPAGTAAAGPMLGAKLMNLIKGRLQKFWLSNNFSVKFTRSRTPAASPDQSWYASDATAIIVRATKRAEGAQGKAFMHEVRKNIVGVVN